MKKKKSARQTRAKKRLTPRDGQKIAERSARRGVPEEVLQGPPAWETIIEDPLQRQAAEREALVDDLGDALGVPRGPDEPIRTSDEILHRRDERRWELES